MAGPAFGSGTDIRGILARSKAMAACYWIEVAILILAAVFRLANLELKPAHFDEGVNGWFVDEMAHSGYYHYDPTNFHGPLHFYVLFVAQTLLGRSTWALRLPIVLLSVGCVALALAFRRSLGTTACRFAALAMAVSPAMVFYGRYAIHETWMVFFLMLILWGIAALWRGGSKSGLWATALGCAGIVLTKETYIIHIVSLLLAAGTLLAYEKLSSSAPLPFARPQWKRRDLVLVSAVAVALVLFFYSGGLLDIGGVSGLWETFTAWVPRGVGDALPVGEKTGHDKPWHYWLQLLAGINLTQPSGNEAPLTTTTSHEWPALFGLIAMFGLLQPRIDRFARYLGIYAAGTFVAYSIISYKTPWCIVSILWPFHLLFGLGVARAMKLLDRWVVGIPAVIVCLFSFAASWQLNFRQFADETEPYVYVQTRLDINKVLDPLYWLVARDPANYHIAGHVVTISQYPLIWLLGDFSRMDFVKPDADQLPSEGDFLLIESTIVEETEGHLREPYFRETLQIRGNSDEQQVLYLRASKFRDFFPNREPEFVPKENIPSV